MAATAINRKARRGNKALRRKRIATTAVAVGSLTLGLAGMPSAQAATGYDVNIGDQSGLHHRHPRGPDQRPVVGGYRHSAVREPGPPASFNPINYSVTQTIPLVGDVLVNVLNATLYGAGPQRLPRHLQRRQRPQ